MVGFKAELVSLCRLWPQAVQLRSSVPSSSPSQADCGQRALCCTQRVWLVTLLSCCPQLGTAPSTSLESPSRAGVHTPPAHPPWPLQPFPAPLAHRSLPGKLVEEREGTPLDGLHGPARHRDVTGFARVYHRVIHAAGAGVPLVMETGK